MGWQDVDVSKVALARRTLEVMAGRRVPDVVFRLSGICPARYGALGGGIPGITGRMLTRTWQRLERDGLGRRIVSTPGGEVVTLEPTGDDADGVLVSLPVALQDAPSVVGAATADRVGSVPVAAR